VTSLCTKSPLASAAHNLFSHRRGGRGVELAVDALRSGSDELPQLVRPERSSPQPPAQEMRSPFVRRPVRAAGRPSEPPRVAAAAVRRSRRRGYPGEYPDAPVLDVDGSIGDAVGLSGGLEHQPALKGVVVVCGHATEDLGHGLLGLLGVVSGEFGERDDCLNADWGGLSPGEFPSQVAR